MPKRTIYQSDLNGEEVMDGEEGYLRVTFGKGHAREEQVVTLIVTAAEAEELIGDAGTVTKKRGRKPAGNGNAAAAKK